MAEGDEYIELKFRIYDGTDISQNSYALSTTITALKQKLFSEWPQGKSVVPKTLNDIKLIHSGKVLENNKTLSESGVRDGAFTGGVITMHVVIQPVLVKKKKRSSHLCWRHSLLSQKLSVPKKKKERMHVGEPGGFISRKSEDCFFLHYII